MDRFTEAQKGIFKVFASDSWKIRLIETFPQDVTPSGDSYVVATSLFSGKGPNYKSLSGLLIAEIYTAFDKGPAPANIIADALDTELTQRIVQLTPTTSVQFYEGVLVHKGRDRDNPTLTRTTFSIPFHYFGV